MATDAPDRSREVSAIANQHNGLFGSDDGRRKILAWICAGLNPRDGGNWGLLQKPNEADVKADIIVWRPTGEHFDVLTDAGATWLAEGPIRPDWLWVPAPDPTGAGGGDPTPTVTLADLEASLLDLISNVNDLEPYVLALLNTEKGIADALTRIERRLDAALKFAHINVTL